MRWLEIDKLDEKINRVKAFTEQSSTYYNLNQADLPCLTLVATRLEKEIEARREGQCRVTDNVNSLRQFIVGCAKFSDDFVKRYNRDMKKKRGKHGKAKKRT
jgi:hypothetical protein